MRKMVWLVLLVVSVLLLVPGMALAAGPEQEGRGRVVGKVVAVHGNVLQVSTRDGEVEVIVDDGTRLRIPGVEQPSLEDIAVDDWVIAVGERTGNALHATGVAVLRRGVRAKVRMLRGEVIGVGEDGLTLRTREGEVWVAVDEGTRYRIAGVTGGSLADLEEGMSVGVAVVEQEDGTLLAKWVVSGKQEGRRVRPRWPMRPRRNTAEVPPFSL